MAEVIQLDRQWLQNESKSVSDIGSAWLLVSGYQASGFGWVTATSVNLGLTPDVTHFAPEHLWDVRLFGEKGEWHCWRVASGWKGRLASTKDWDEPRRRRRTFALWGNESKADEAWWHITEQRGTTVKVPKAMFPVLNQAHLPLMLEVWELLKPEPGTGLAGVCDAMLRGLLRQGDREAI